MKTMLEHPAVEYATKVWLKEINAPRYVRLQCKEFLVICAGRSEDYCINWGLLEKIYKILKVLKMAKGPCAGKSLYASLAGYQWLLVTGALCTVYREDNRRRKYQTIVLEICRKNGKTFIVAVIFILLFYLEPPYSRFFSVAPDGALAREIKEALEPLLRQNEEVFEKNEFKILRDYILHNPTKTKYTPLNFSTSRMDGKEPNVFIADEVGALPISYPIEAMRSGQLLVKNKLGFVISTKYPKIDNPFEEEIEYAKKVLDGLVEDEKIFSLLYEPDKTKEWENDDTVLAHGNPLALEIESVWDDLISKRTKAILRPALRENFLCKHCNIIYQGTGTETYVPIDQVQACRTSEIDWNGREVYVGVDLAMSNDNCAVAMSAEEDGEIYSFVMFFIPEGRMEEKTQEERFDYRISVKAGHCIACGDLTVDYKVIEDYVFSLEECFGVTIQAIGYDRYNALSSAQKWEREYKTVEVRQHSDTLHPPTKLLAEKIANKEWHYEKNEILESNFSNAKCTYDTNMNRYVNKKKSRGKIDGIAALITSVFLLQQDIYLNTDDFTVQIF